MRRTRHRRRTLLDKSGSIRYEFLVADPGLSAAIAGLKAAAEKLSAWRQEADAAAKTKEARDAMMTTYYAGLLLNTVRQLDAQFHALRLEVEKLADDWDQGQRDALADRVGGLARSEVLLDRLQESATFLESHAKTEVGRFGRMLQKVGKKRGELEGSLWELRQLANDALQWIGARERAPTPAGIGDVEVAVRRATDDERVEAAKELARAALGVIDSYAARQGRAEYGRLASALSRAHGLTPPVEGVGL